MSEERNYAGYSLYKGDYQTHQLIFCSPLQKLYVHDHFQFFCDNQYWSKIMFHEFTNRVAFRLSIN